MLNHHAIYSVNERALRKWSPSGCNSRPWPDGSVEARFRYEGTTCSNLGPAARVRLPGPLGAAGAGHPIVEAACLPAPGDTGHQFMCEYLNDAKAFMSRIASEKPLLGRPLDDVLTWERPDNPSGCYCAGDSRRTSGGWCLR